MSAALIASSTFFLIFSEYFPTLQREYHNVWYNRQLRTLRYRKRYTLHFDHHNNNSFSTASEICSVTELGTIAIILYTYCLCASYRFRLLINMAVVMNKHKAVDIIIIMHHTTAYYRLHWIPRLFCNCFIFLAITQGSFCRHIFQSCTRVKPSPW